MGDRTVWHGVFVGWGLVGDGIHTSPSKDLCARSRGLQKMTPNLRLRSPL